MRNAFTALLLGVLLGIAPAGSASAGGGHNCLKPWEYGRISDGMTKRQVERRFGVRSDGTTFQGRYGRPANRREEIYQACGRSHFTAVYYVKRHGKWRVYRKDWSSDGVRWRGANRP